MGVYYTTMKRLWDELDDMSEVPVCACATSCQAIKKTMALAERQRLMHFLMHLNENYEVLRGQILLLDPLPNVNKAYSMIQRVETQRNVTGNITTTRDMAANVTRLANITNTVEQENVASAFIARGGPKARKKIKKNKSNRLYDHCQRFGHTVDQCFKLIGYPNW